MRAHLELRERSILDVLDLSVRFLRAHAGKYARLSAAVVLPGFVVSLAAAAGVGWWLGWLVAIGVGALAQAPFTLLASRLVFEGEVPLRTVLRDALRALPTIVGVRVIQLVLVLLGACLFLVGQFWVGAVLLYATEAALLERMTAGAAISRANRVVTGANGEALLTLLLLLLLTGGAVYLGDKAGRSLLEDLLQVEAPAALFDAGGNWLALAGFWLAVPYLATARFLAYLNVRTRAEGWDVQTRFFTLAALAKADDESPVSRRAA